VFDRLNENDKMKETQMVSKSFRRNITNEERLFLRQWTYAVAIVYGVFALALVGSSVLITSKDTLEATNAPAHNHAAGTLSAGRSNEVP
jgi:hypothetical protein